VPSNPNNGALRPLSDRRYLAKGPPVPYRLGELLLLLLDLAVIFFGIKITEGIYGSVKGGPLIQAERTLQATARKEEDEMLATRTARRDSLKLVEESTLVARHADSLRIAELDTTFNQVITEIEARAVDVQKKVVEVQQAGNTERLAKKELVKAEDVAAKKKAKIEKTRPDLATFAPKIEEAHADAREAEAALAVTLSKRPEVVVPATSSAVVGTSVVVTAPEPDQGEKDGQGQLFSTVGLGRSFLNFGRAQLGVSASAGFGSEKTTVSGGGLFINFPIIPDRASVDVSSGASFLTDIGGTSTSPYLAGSLRYSLMRGRRFYLVTDGRVSHDRVWTGIGLSIGRR